MRDYKNILMHTIRTIDKLFIIRHAIGAVYNEL